MYKYFFSFSFYILFIPTRNANFQKKEISPNYGAKFLFEDDKVTLLHPGTKELTFSHFISELYLQHCVFIEIGEGFCSLIVELPSHTEEEEEILPTYFGVCHCSEFHNWKLCNNKLLKHRPEDCLFKEGHQHSTSGSRVHRRLCDITGINKWNQQCNCSQELARQQLFPVRGFKTCFRSPMPESICVPRSVCGVAKCRSEVVPPIYVVECAENCVDQQQFCERKGPETARKRRIVSEWTKWSAPVSHSISHGKKVIYEHAERSEALCVNHIQSCSGYDCLGPGHNCCDEPDKLCKCEVKLIRGQLKVVRLVIQEPDKIDNILDRKRTYQKMMQHTIKGRSANSSIFSRVWNKFVKNISEYNTEVVPDINHESEENEKIIDDILFNEVNDRENKIKEESNENHPLKQSSNGKILPNKDKNEKVTNYGRSNDHYNIKVNEKEKGKDHTKSVQYHPSENSSVLQAGKKYKKIVFETKKETLEENKINKSEKDKHFKFSLNKLKQKEPKVSVFENNKHYNTQLIVKTDNHELPVENQMILKKYLSKSINKIITVKSSALVIKPTKSDYKSVTIKPSVGFKHLSKTDIKHFKMNPSSQLIDKPLQKFNNKQITKTPSVDFKHLSKTNNKKVTINPLAAITGKHLQKTGYKTVTMISPTAFNHLQKGRNKKNMTIISPIFKSFPKMKKPNVNINLYETVTSKHLVKSGKEKVASIPFAFKDLLKTNNKISIGPSVAVTGKHLQKYEKEKVTSIPFSFKHLSKTDKEKVSISPPVAVTGKHLLKYGREKCEFISFSLNRLSKTYNKKNAISPFVAVTGKHLQKFGKEKVTYIPFSFKHLSNTDNTKVSVNLSATVNGKHLQKAGNKKGTMNPSTILNYLEKFHNKQSTIKPSIQWNNLSTGNKKVMRKMPVLLKLVTKPNYKTISLKPTKYKYSSKYCKKEVAMETFVTPPVQKSTSVTQKAKHKNKKTTRL